MKTANFTHGFQAVTLNQYLDADNVWTQRLLQKTSFQRHRTIEHVEKEYNQDKYKKLIDARLKTIEENKTQEFKNSGLSPETPIFLSFGNDLFKCSLSLARACLYQVIKDYVGRYASSNLGEMGCGYGYNLSYLSSMSNVYGGEYSSHAVKLGKRLGFNIAPFNYYQKDDYAFIKPDSTLLSVHSIEQIPDAAVILENLARYKRRIRYVIHIEPSFVEERKDLIGNLRNTYITMNDYNRNLFSLLRGRNDMEILDYKQDVLGLNPLNSSNIMIWKFKK